MVYLQKNVKSVLQNLNFPLQIEREMIASYESDAAGAQRATLKRYDYIDTWADPQVLEKYSTKLDSVKASIIKPLKERGMAAGKQGKGGAPAGAAGNKQQGKAVGSGAAGMKGGNKSGTTGAGAKGGAKGQHMTTGEELHQDQVDAQSSIFKKIRSLKLLFDVRMILADRAYSEEELMKKLQREYPNTAITIPLLEQVVNLINDKGYYEKSEGISLTPLYPSDKEDLIGITECLTIKPEMMERMKNVHYLYHTGFGTHTGYTMTPWKLFEQSKRVYYYKKFSDQSFWYNQTKYFKLIRQYVFEYFDECGAGVEQDVVKKIKRKLPGFEVCTLDQLEEVEQNEGKKAEKFDGLKISASDLRRLINEFAQWKNGLYIFHGFIGK